MKTSRKKSLSSETIKNYLYIRFNLVTVIGAMYVGARGLRHPLKLLWNIGHPLD